jgi:energy-coupling factor transport system ATP-binding protein
MSAAVVFENVSFTYPDASERALVDVSLEVEEGAFTLVTGATGSGKSTLLRAMNGLVPHFSGGAFSGRVIAQGHSTLDHPPRALAHLLGFVPQDPGASFVVDRVEDELAYGLENLGVTPQIMRRRVEETLVLMDVEHLRDRSVRTLSGGERQRVAIAAVLAAGPSTLLLDEPTSQLDPQGAEDVLAALRRLVDDLGMTVVLAEHRLERVAGFADRAIGCRTGAPPLVGSPGDVFEAVGTGPPVTVLGRLMGWRPVPLTVRDARRAASGLELAQAPPERSGVGEPTLLEARAVEAEYDRRVLHRVDLSLRRGEVVVLMGRNGAGKSTLLRVLAGLHPLLAGTVRTREGSPRPGRDVALCPQMPETVLFKESVRDEIATSLAAVGRDGPVHDLLEHLGLGDLSERHPRDLSSGQRLLVAVAAIAATGAPVLLLDEPTRGLDPDSKRRLCRLLEGLTGDGGAALVATHDVELAAALAGRVVLLAAGEVIAEGTPAEVLSDSPVFAPQMARVLGPGWLTPEQVAAAAGADAAANVPAARA